VVIKSKILQVVGYQNSGKTTVVSQLISNLSAEGLSVGVIKHHGHAATIATGDANKDTGLHREAGAVTTCVEGNGMMQLTSTHTDALKFNTLINFYDKLNHDCILIEGYKREKYPKVLLLRSEEDGTLLTELENIVAVIRWNGVDVKVEHAPLFEINELSVFLRWVILYIRGDKQNE
jgi:molybdopterin-guanine dinucleotide biosynthesis protein B